MTKTSDHTRRLNGGAALAQHAVAPFYVADVSRYHFLTWFFTSVVDMVWLHDVGVPSFRTHCPAMAKRIESHPWRLRLASAIAHLQKSTA